MVNLESIEQLTAICTDVNGCRYWSCATVISILSRVRELEAGLAGTEKERNALREALVGVINEVIMGDPERIRMAITVSHGLLEIVPVALAAES